MSTPASIRVFAANGDCLVHIYTQHDGYPEGCGLDIAQYLHRVTKNNKLNYELANGDMDLAAQLVLTLKMTLKTTSLWGGIYLIPYSEKKQRWDWEYRYDIEVADGDTVWIRAKEGRKNIFAGDVASFVAFCNKAKA